MKKTTIDAMVARQLALPVPLHREAIETAQFSLLRQTLAHAKSNNAFYKKHLADIDPQKIRSRNDLAKLPFLTPEIVTAEGSQLPLQCLSQSRIARIITLATSGSTGKPKRIAFDITDLQSTGEFFREGMKNLLQKDDAALILLPANIPDSTGDLLRRSLEEIGSPAFTLWPPQADTAAGLIAAHTIRTVIGLPQHLLALSCHLAKTTKIAKDTIRTMLLCSDYAAPSLRKRIEENCGCTTFLHYGTTESGLGGGVECAAHHGCHLREADFLLEIIDPDTQRPLPDGKIGEVVLTTISRKCMPLFRYRSGDIAALLHTPCSCGGITARLGSILGRQPCHTLANGEILASSRLDDLLFAEPALLDYRASLHHRNGREQLDIDYLATTLLPADRLLELLPKELPLGRLTQRSADFFFRNHTIKRIIDDKRTPLYP